MSREHCIKRDQCYFSTQMALRNIPDLINLCVGISLCFSCQWTVCCHPFLLREKRTIRCTFYRAEQKGSGENRRNPVLEGIYAAELTLHPQGFGTRFAPGSDPLNHVYSPREDPWRWLYIRNMKQEAGTLMMLQSTDKKRKVHSEKRGRSESSRFHPLCYKQFLHSGQSHPLNIYESCSPTVSST